MQKDIDTNQVLESMHKLQFLGGGSGEVCGFFFFSPLYKIDLFTLNHYQAYHLNFTKNLLQIDQRLCLTWSHLFQ